MAEKRQTVLQGPGIYIYIYTCLFTGVFTVKFSYERKTGVCLPVLKCVPVACPKRKTKQKASTGDEVLHPSPYMRALQWDDQKEACPSPSSSRTGGTCPTLDRCSLLRWGKWDRWQCSGLLSQPCCFQQWEVEHVSLP